MKDGKWEESTEDEVEEGIEDKVKYEVFETLLNDFQKNGKKR